MAQFEGGGIRREDWKRANEIAAQIQREIDEEKRVGKVKKPPGITADDWRRAEQIARDIASMPRGAGTDSRRDAHVPKHHDAPIERRPHVPPAGTGRGTPVIEAKAGAGKNVKEVLAGFDTKVRASGYGSPGNAHADRSQSGRESLLNDPKVVAAAARAREEVARKQKEAIRAKMQGATLDWDAEIDKRRKTKTDAPPPMPTGRRLREVMREADPSVEETIQEVDAEREQQALAARRKAELREVLSRIEVSERKISRGHAERILQDIRGEVPESRQGQNTMGGEIAKMIQQKPWKGEVRKILTGKRRQERINDARLLGSRPETQKEALKGTLEDLKKIGRDIREGREEARNRTGKTIGELQKDDIKQWWSRTVARLRNKTNAARNSQTAVAGAAADESRKPDASVVDAWHRERERVVPEKKMPEVFAREIERERAREQSRPPEEHPSSRDPAVRPSSPDMTRESPERVPQADGSPPTPPMTASSSFDEGGMRRFSVRPETDLRRSSGLRRFWDRWWYIRDRQDSLQEQKRGSFGWLAEWALNPDFNHERSKAAANQAFFEAVQAHGRGGVYIFNEYERKAVIDRAQEIYDELKRKEDEKRGLSWRRHKE